MNKHAMAYIVLAIVFGMFGIHNFYAGHNSRAIGQLCLTVLTGWLVFPLVMVFIWVLIDICTINFDAQGKCFK